MPEADLADKVKALCARDQKYRDLLLEICTVDKIYENDNFGWQFKDIKGFSGAHVNVLMQEGIIKYGYKSNNATHFRAVEREGLKQVLDEIPDETEKQEWFKEKEVKQTFLNPELTAEFEQLLQTEKDMLSYWAQRLNPRLIGMEKERQGCLIALASPKDKQGIRRRVHTLIYGPPGTAKSILIQYIKHYLDAVGTGPTSSEAGLKMDARGSGTAGKLMMAHNRTLVVEELDKFDRKTLESLYESMTTGEFEVDKGDIRETCIAAIRAIAVANSIEKLPLPLLDRFDMIFYVEIPNKEAEKKITDDLYLQWITSKEDYRGEKLRAYLEWIEGYEPEITPEVMDRCMRLKNAYIDLAEKKPDVREKEGFLRVGFVIARINRRALCLDDFLQAIKLVDANFNGAKMNALEILAKELSKS